MYPQQLPNPNLVTQQQPFQFQQPFPIQQQTPFPNFQGQQQPFPFPQQNLQQFAMLNQVIQYGMWEAQLTGYPHALQEVALISYLMGRGYSFPVAKQIAESFEVNETYPMF